MFLRNAWYVAGWEHEFNRELKQIKVLAEKIAVYRCEDGKPVALKDACPHRKLPLSNGRLVGDTVECGYHGLTFDCAGTCVRVYGQARIPPAAKVRSYPVCDKWGLLWIWMGDAELANTDDIFPVEHFDEPGWGINKGDTMILNCNYLYMTDNLLDPSHVAWVHRSSFGNAACEDTPLKTDVDDSGVTVSRWMNDVEVAPFYKQCVPFTGNTDRKQHYEVRYPSNAIIRAIFAPAGHGGDDQYKEDECFIMDSYNFMTPVDENQTRYFWFQVRNVKPDSEELSQIMSKGVKNAFEEDRQVLNLVHQGIKDDPDTLDLSLDVGALRFRKRLGEMINSEQQSTA